MVARRDVIRRKAEGAREEFFQHRYDGRWTDRPPDLYSIEPEKIVELWGINFDEPIEILLRNDFAPYSAMPKYAGYFDPVRNTIAVAQNLLPEVRQFTIAHELGHAALHREKGVLFRDHPVTGAELEDRHRGPEEREADLFAADLLMPEDRVRAAFQLYFGTPSLADVPRDEAIANQLSMPKRPVTAIKLRTRGKRYLSLLLANSSPWGYTSDLKAMPPLCKIFGVSITAMAIQLESLRLI